MKQVSWALRAFFRLHNLVYTLRIFNSELSETKIYKTYIKWNTIIIYKKLFSKLLAVPKTNLGL